MGAVDSNQRFGVNVRRLRESAGLSQEELGQASGLHRTEISLLERAIRDPRLSTIAKVAQGLGVAPAELLEGLSCRAPSRRLEDEGLARRPRTA
jgi:transcriptional regulator with XRE-family HTH domain